MCAGYRCLFVRVLPVRIPIFINDLVLGAKGGIDNLESAVGIGGARAIRIRIRIRIACECQIRTHCTAAAAAECTVQPGTQIGRVRMSRSLHSKLLQLLFEKRFVPRGTKTETQPGRVYYIFVCVRCVPREKI